MLIISIIMILLAGFGIWGAYKLNPNYLSAFWGVLFACALFLIVVGVLGIVFPKRIKVKGCGSTYYSSIGAMNETATRAVKAICQNCTCFYNITNSSAPVSAYNINSTDPSLPTRAQMCTNWTSTKWDDIMATLERDFSCASWCPGTLGVIYLMSNVNYGNISLTQGFHRDLALPLCWIGTNSFVSGLPYLPLSLLHLLCLF